ncbi:Hsp33 family molecular chaperone HslO [Halobacteriovorax sp. GB3]|uniref:Hsp33 family molecular chaperone HslO n=1 Tax=Halobacteriovorax sp. GB3 TaxID=2719615 RepID=UPI00235EE116|nr:Hsp33 family molecular chaperone HslO [Halobacteriovorax sp. GB3]MDD0852420.1 Hsp33 family molecular chaperone HslO [Halobacteriovorax sp. GB3]
MLLESRLYTFIDSKNAFTLSFLEGQKLIHDLAIIHNIKGKGFAYFRDSVLTAMPLISYLKQGEGMGIFLDSEDPFFRLKIEANQAGYMRTLLIPEDFQEFPSKVSGIARLSKTFPNNPKPYTSIIQLNQIDFHDVINKIIQESYQMDAKVVISDKSDQSILLSRLPDRNVNKEEREERDSLNEYWIKTQAKIQAIFEKSLNEQETIQKAFEDLGFEYLSGVDVAFKCSCSRERMVQGIQSLCQTHSVEEIFENKNDIETKCDYCKTHYLIQRSDLTLN